MSASELDDTALDVLVAELLPDMPEPDGWHDAQRTRLLDHITNSASTPQSVDQDVGGTAGGEPAADTHVREVTAVRPARRHQRGWILVTATAAATVLGLIAAAGVGIGRHDDTPADAPPIEPTAATAAPATSVDVTTPEVTASPPSSTIEVAPLQRALSRGTSGEDVRVVQQRLADLAFNPGPVDGAFSDYTQQAVWAFETLVLGVPFDRVTGVVTPEMWEAMQGDVEIAPRRTNLTPTHVEVYLPQQALVVFRDNVAVLVAHISSGALAEPSTDFTSGANWCEEVTISTGDGGNEGGTTPVVDGQCGNSLTPGGTYRFSRSYDGERLSARGGMFNPVYFNYDLAIYGAVNVPQRPASHGGIRINMYLATILPGYLSASGSEARPTGDQIYVWDGAHDPERYGAKAPRFTWPWLEWRAAHGG